MNFLIAIPAFSFGVLLLVSAYVFSTRRGSLDWNGVGPLLAVPLGILGLELIMLFPGAESHVEMLLHLGPAVWMLMGIAVLHAVYHLLGRPKDRWYVAMLVWALAAAVAQAVPGLTFRGFVQTSMGPSPVRHGVIHALVCVAPAASVLLALRMLRRENREDLLPATRRAYRMLWGAAIFAMIPVVLFTILLPHFLGIHVVAKLASSIAAWLVILVLGIVRHQGLLHINLDAVADSVFEYMQEGVIVVGTGDRVRRMNRAARELLHVRGIYAGTPIGELLPDLRGSRLRRDFGAGERDLLVAQYSRVKSDAELSRTIVIRDETANREAQAVLRRSRDELEKIAAARTIRLRQAQRLEALATISGGISNDFNTLLTQIVGDVTSAASTLEISHPVHEDLDEVLNAARRARDIVKQMLYFADNATRKHVPVDGIRLVQDTLKIAQISVPPNVKVQFARCNGDAPLEGDPTRLHQAVLNLVTNALHAMEPGGGTLFVGVEVEEMTEAVECTSGSLDGGTYVVISVKDTGQGISGDVARKIFEPFFTTKKQGKGTGIGLATVQRVVEEHGGEVDMESTPGRGTRFSLYLPISPGGPE